MYKKYFTEEDKLINKANSNKNYEVNISSKLLTKLIVILVICLVYSFILSISTLQREGILPASFAINFISSIIKGVLSSSVIVVLLLFASGSLYIYDKTLYKDIDEILPNAYFKRKHDIPFNGKTVIRLGNRISQLGILYCEKGNDYFLMRDVYTSVTKRVNGKSKTSTYFDGVVIEIPLVTGYLDTYVRINSTNKELGKEVSKFPVRENEVKVDLEGIYFNDNYDVYSLNTLTATKVISPVVIDNLSRMRTIYSDFAILIENNRMFVAIYNERIRVLPSVNVLKELLTFVQDIRNAIEI